MGTQCADNHKWMLDCHICHTLPKLQFCRQKSDHCLLQDKYHNPPASMDKVQRVKDRKPIIVSAQWVPKDINKQNMYTNTRSIHCISCICIQMYRYSCLSVEYQKTSMNTPCITIHVERSDSCPRFIKGPMTWSGVYVLV